MDDDLGTPAHSAVIFLARKYITAIVRLIKTKPERRKGYGAGAIRTHDRRVSPNPRWHEKSIISAPTVPHTPAPSSRHQ
ncbi:MAG TPA: hypothetical protein ENF24_02215 [Methanosarcinales archaeon]|nr:hypothetical protein [Methanosarcinales archaeon]